MARPALRRRCRHASHPPPARISRSSIALARADHGGAANLRKLAAIARRDLGEDDVAVLQLADRSRAAPRDCADRRTAAGNCRRRRATSNATSVRRPVRPRSCRAERFPTAARSQLRRCASPRAHWRSRRRSWHPRRIEDDGVGRLGARQRGVEPFAHAPGRERHAGDADRPAASLRPSIGHQPIDQHRRRRSTCQPGAFLGGALGVPLPA